MADEKKEWFVPLNSTAYGTYWLGENNKPQREEFQSAWELEKKIPPSPVPTTEKSNTVAVTFNAANNFMTVAAGYLVDKIGNFIEPYESIPGERLGPEGPG